MQVFIMRHGDAALDAASDSVRPLTTNGCDESRLMANWLKGQKVEIERVLVSPFLRAEQTLEEVGDCLNLPSSAEVLPELTPCGDVGLVSAYLQALTNEGVASVLVISHLPLVGYLVAELCPGETPPMFTTSAIASVTLDESGSGTFNWQMSPCNLRWQKLSDVFQIMPNEVDSLGIIAHQAADICQPHYYRRLSLSINKTLSTFIRKLFFCAYLDFAQSYMLK